MTQLPYLCHICGWQLIESPWDRSRSNQKFDVCPCCGYHFAEQDFTVGGIQTKRQEWIASGCTWGDPSQKSSAWKLEEQMSRLPKVQSTDEPSVSAVVVTSQRICIPRRAELESSRAKAADVQPVAVNACDASVEKQ